MRRLLALVAEHEALVSVPLLVTSLSRARRIHERGDVLPKHALHLVVAEAGDRNLRGALEGARCDFIVRRPVDPAVLGFGETWSSRAMSSSSCRTAPACAAAPPST